MRTWLIILLLILICGCAVGPDYQRPGYPVPTTYRGEGPDIPSQPAAASFGDLKWFEVFKDEKLQELIKIALQENYDVQIAAQRVLQAREQVVIQRSFLFPTVNANTQLNPVRTSERGINFLSPRLERVSGLVFGDVAWELDFFGRIRRATEAARAEFFASEENRKFVIQTLVTDLASPNLWGLLNKKIKHSLYVGQSKIRGVLCHHLSFDSDDVQLQLWIDAGDQPLPRKVVLTHKNLPGSPQWTAYLSDWNLSPQINDNLFSFTPPRGAEKIKFVPVQAGQAPKPRPEKKKKGGMS